MALPTPLTQKTSLLAEASSNEPFFGWINPPEELKAYGANGGLIVFISNMISLAVLVGGIIAFINIIIAGFTYISSAGDSKATEKVLQKLNMSFWGLALMIMAPAIMAVIGWVLFKEPMYFLRPELKEPQPLSMGGF